MSLQDLIGQLRWQADFRRKQAVELQTSVPYNNNWEKDHNFEQAAACQEDAQTLEKAIAILEGQSTPSPQGGNHA